MITSVTVSEIRVDERARDNSTYGGVAIENEVFGEEDDWEGAQPVRSPRPLTRRNVPLKQHEDA